MAPSKPIDCGKKYTCHAWVCIFSKFNILKTVERCSLVCLSIMNFLSFHPFLAVKSFFSNQGRDFCFFSSDHSNERFELLSIWCKNWAFKTELECLSTTLVMLQDVKWIKGIKSFVKHVQICCYLANNSSSIVWRL